MYERIHVNYRKENANRISNLFGMWYVVFAVFCGNDNCYNIVSSGGILTIQARMLSSLVKYSILHNRSNTLWLSGDASDDYRERLSCKWWGNKLKNKN